MFFEKVKKLRLCGISKFVDWLFNSKSIIALNGNRDGLSACLFDNDSNELTRAQRSWDEATMEKGEIKTDDVRCKKIT